MPFTPDLHDYLSEIQSETKAFRLKVRHTEGPPIPDWLWRHCKIFFLIGLKKRVNLVLFFKPSLGVLYDINENYYTRHPLITIFVHFYYSPKEKKLLDENDVEFDCTIGHVLTMFPFLWIEKEKCQENHSPLRPPLKSLYIYMYIIVYIYTACVSIFSQTHYFHQS